MAVTLLLVGGVTTGMAFSTDAPSSPYTQWENGPSSDPSFFPIGVWLQSPRMASRYKQAGINLYMGLWKGPTEEQLALLKIHGMRVIAHQNEIGLRYKHDPLIMGWMHDDEPDNAQPKPEGGYGPPIPPLEIINDYERMVTTDSTRPVIINLGQGVANDEWHGRGPNAKQEDYLEYCRGADIVSFDVYPVAGIRKPDGENYLWYVAKGLDRLRTWCGPSKVIWNVIETTNISSDRCATPHQLRAEVWMSLIHGSQGIIYFVHRFQPTFLEAALLYDPEMLAAVTEINKQIHELATILNSPSVEGIATAISRNPAVPIDTMTKRDGDTTYLFAVGMRNAATEGVFTLEDMKGKLRVEVIGENRTIEADNGTFTDTFDPYDVHLYKAVSVTPNVIAKEGK